MCALFSPEILQAGAVKRLTFCSRFQTALALCWHRLPRVHPKLLSHFISTAVHFGVAFAFW